MQKLNHPIASRANKARGVPQRLGVPLCNLCRCPKISQGAVTLPATKLLRHLKWHWFTMIIREKPRKARAPQRVRRYVCCRYACGYCSCFQSCVDHVPCDTLRIRVPREHIICFHPFRNQPEPCHVPYDALCVLHIRNRMEAPSSTLTRPCRLVAVKNHLQLSYLIKLIYRRHIDLTPASF